MDAHLEHKNRYRDAALVYGVPEHTIGSLNRYVFDHIPPGGFLRSVLSNDLFGAFGKADDPNQRAMREICDFIYNNVPSGAWGSPEKVAKWLGESDG